jgi:hypothetical protein
MVERSKLSFLAKNGFGDPAGKLPVFDYQIIGFIGVKAQVGRPWR